MPGFFWKHHPLKSHPSPRITSHPHKLRASNLTLESHITTKIHIWVKWVKWVKWHNAIPAILPNRFLPFLQFFAIFAISAICILFYMTNHIRPHGRNGRNCIMPFLPLNHMQKWQEWHNAIPAILPFPAIMPFCHWATCALGDSGNSRGTAPSHP